MFGLLYYAWEDYHAFEIANPNVLVRLSVRSCQYWHMHVPATTMCLSENRIICFFYFFFHAFLLKSGPISEAVIWHQNWLWYSYKHSPRRVLTVISMAGMWPQMCVPNPDWRFQPSWKHDLKYVQMWSTLNVELWCFMVVQCAAHNVSTIKGVAVKRNMYACVPGPFVANC